MPPPRSLTLPKLLRGLLERPLVVAVAAAAASGLERGPKELVSYEGRANGEDAAAAGVVVAAKAEAAA